MTDKNDWKNGSESLTPPKATRPTLDHEQRSLTPPKAVRPKPSSGTDKGK
jgi:hypothetical protein